MNIADIEKQILKFWKESNAFKRSVERRSKTRTSTNGQHKGSFVFYEGPPTANGKPGIHHVEARSFKDIICRYKTMQGFRVERRGGWDTHGLPVELEIEKALGINNKKEIEQYGVAKFNKKCKESVWRYKKEWENLTERMGFWIDMENPYITYDPLYMETLWWIIKQIYEMGLLYEGHKVIPRCPRCGTGLSSHEVAQGYQTITENSVIVKFPVINDQLSIRQEKKSQIFFLAWTTTPWTLPGNVALAVGENIEYAVVEQNGEYYILAKELVERVFEPKTYNLKPKTYKGSDLVGVEYKPLFDIKELKSDNSYKVYSADFVTTEEGTGIVHTAVMYGEDDYQLGDKFDLPKHHTVNENGHFNRLVAEFEGQFVKDAEPAIVEFLKVKNQLYKVLPHKHTYPFCWRCGTPLLYYAMDSWFIAMSKLQKQLIDANKKINWVPEYIKEGRFGEWLREIKDWAFSRSRYWGTPLPVWKCSDCQNLEVVGSREDLAKVTKGRNEYFILRHGFSKRNHHNILSCVEKKESKAFGLMPQGIKEVENSAQKLKKLGGVDFIISSPLTRTKQTAKIVAEHLGGVDIKYSEDIIEIKAGIFEGKNVQDYRDYFSDTKERFTKKVPGGETLSEMRKRMTKFADDLEKKYNGKRILIVSHGDPIWILESAMLGLSVDETVKREGENYPHTGQLRHIQYAKFPYNKEGELDFHRPFVDEIKFSCEKCPNGQMERVKDLVDVWFDSGAMPFAQEHYPFENKAKIDKKTYYPADYISEAIDQTRGWFYTMHAISAILGKAPSYKNVISLGHVLDAKGQKMSKSMGNIIDSQELAEKYGMDAVRWYFFTVNNPGAVKRFSEQDVKEKLQRFISTLLNSYTFLNTYSPKTKAPIKFSHIKTNNLLDKWINAKLKFLAKQVTAALDIYNIMDASRAIDKFVLEDLSNWYVRRSRERFQKSENKNDKNNAAQTLAFVLSEVCKLSAPFVPFISEYIWQKVNRIDKKSVHWEDFPSYTNVTKQEKEIMDLMQKVQSWAQAGLSIRSDNSIKVRQPLNAFAVSEKSPVEYKEILKDELNVKEIVNSKNLKADKNWKAFKDDKKILLNTKITEDLQIEGNIRELVRNIQKMRKTLGLHPNDKIKIKYSLPQYAYEKLKKWEKRIIQDTNAIKISEEKILSEHGKTYDAKIEFEWDNKNKVAVAIDKV